MPAIGFHLCMRFQEDRVFAATRADRIALAGMVFRSDHRKRVLAFRAADTHTHFAYLGEEGECREMAGRFANALTHQLRFGMPLQPPRLRAFTDIHHLANSFHYILNQERHHQVRKDLLHEGSNLPDLLEMRVLGNRGASLLAAALPRVTLRDLLEHLEVPDLEPETLDPTYLRASMAAAIGQVALARNSPLSRRARAAAVRIGRVFLTVGQTAHHLGLEERTVRRLQKAEPDPALERAIRRQVALRMRLGQAGVDVAALDRGEALPLR